MGVVDAGFAVSLDGFVADKKDDISALYAWMVGAVEQNTPLDDMELTEHGEETQQSRSTELGAIVSGRRTFDLAKGWGGRHPLGVPVVVLTHEVPTEWANDGNPFTFVTGGVKEAIATAQQIAGEGRISVCGPDVMRQALEAGLVDEIGMDLVPVLLGGGVPMFTGAEQVRLEKVEARDGVGVTHLRYRVVRD